MAAATHHCRLLHDPHRPHPRGIFAPWIAPHDPTKQLLLARNRPPAWLAGGSTNFLLGTDDLGRDVLSRVLYGARISLGIGFIATIIGTVIGTRARSPRGFLPRPGGLAR